jgi:glycosyltransferase involved in cell wall biosynthesis
LDNLTTFIVPTINRTSLRNAINSIQKQTLNNWECIIVYDGIKTPAPADLWTIFGITELYICKLGETKNGRSFAGKVRNRTFELVHTPWISFLDDDDALNIFYLYWLNRYIKENPELDCIIFSMGYANNSKLPKQYDDFVAGEVGISFSVKTEFIRKHNILFDNSDNEDFQFLDQIRNAGGKIKMSEQFMYYIRPYIHFPD